MAGIRARIRAKREADAEKGVKLRIPRRRLILIAAVTGVAWLAFVLVGQGGSDGDDSSGDDDRVATTTNPASTVAFDSPVHCEALGSFSSAALSLSKEQDPGKLTTALEVMSSSLDDLDGATGHPELVEQTELLSPVVNDALQAVRGASPEDVQRLAQDPRFADPALVDATRAIIAYPLRCP